ncbi:histidine phosphatase family protein, partial [Candidatus Kaiserbacteria bacterium]|nr:histidine phosphatase family protein [Candidatus Kaiserbacteria bacterium]
MSDVTTKPKRIYFVRHGEALGNATNISQDATTPLTDTGHAQAKVVAERVAGLGIDHVYTSNMVRAIETGSYIAKTLGLYPEASELFREWSTPESVRGKHHDSPEYEAWLEELTTGYDDPSWRFEDAENFADLLKRAEEGVELLESSQHQHILVV